MKKKRTRRDQCLQALSVVMNYYEYDGYAKSDAKAIKALNQRLPTLTRRQCANLFNKHLGCYEAAIRFVEKNVPHYLETYRKKISGRQVYPEETRFADKYKTIPRSVVIAAIDWIFYWRHLR